MIRCGNELLRINTQKNDIEYSKDGGRTWHEWWATAEEKEIALSIVYVL